MLNVQMSPSVMELLPLVCLCLLTLSGSTFADGNGPAVINVVVKEGNDTILPCSLSTNENIEQKLFDWKKDGQTEVFMYDAGVHYNNGRTGQDEQFRGRVFHFPEQLKFGNASIVIRDTKVTDSGNYTCDFPRHQPSRQSLISLLVGASAEPSITTLGETKDGVQLKCLVRGASPKPKLQWQDSSGNILPADEPQVTQRGDKYDVILQTTVTETDRYRCVATQEEIYHQIYTETYVPVHGASPKASFTIVEQTQHWALLQCNVQGASPKPNVYWKDSSGKVLPAKPPQVTERGGSYDVILQVNVTKTDRYHCVTTQDEINHQIHTKTHIYIAGGQSTGTSNTVVVALCLALLVTIS